MQHCFEIGDSSLRNVNYSITCTPPKINIEPENDGLEDDFPFPRVYSQVPAVHLPGCTD